MIEITPSMVDTDLLYFHTRRSSGDEIAPFIDNLRKELPRTKVICVDNLWVRERERQRGANSELFKVFRRYGIHAEGVTLSDGQGVPDEFMFREAIRQIKVVLRHD